jgi:transposase
MKGSTEEGKMATPRRQYTEEFKREAIRLAGQPGLGPTQVAKDLGINRTMLSTWIRQAATAGGDAFRGNGNRTALELENFTLKRRIRVLEEEREILKKAATWFAKESR